MSVRVGASIGVALSRPGAKTNGELLRCADVAMYDAKRTHSGVSAYRPEARSPQPGTPCPHRRPERRHQLPGPHHVLPTHTGHAHRHHQRPRSPRPLATPQPRAALPRQLHPSRRAERVDATAHPCRPRYGRWPSRPPGPRRSPARDEREHFALRPRRRGPGRATSTASWRSMVSHPTA